MILIITFVFRSRRYNDCLLKLKKNKQLKYSGTPVEWMPLGSYVSA